MSKDDIQRYVPDPGTLAGVLEKGREQTRRMAADEELKRVAGALEAAHAEPAPREASASEKAEYVGPKTVPDLRQPALLTQSKIKVARGLDPRSQKTTSLARSDRSPEDLFRDVSGDGRVDQAVVRPRKARGVVLFLAGVGCGVVVIGGAVIVRGLRADTTESPASSVVTASSPSLQPVPTSLASAEQRGSDPSAGASETSAQASSAAPTDSSAKMLPALSATAATTGAVTVPGSRAQECAPSDGASTGDGCSERAGTVSGVAAHPRAHRDSHDGPAPPGLNMRVSLQLSVVVLVASLGATGSAWAEDEPFVAHYKRANALYDEKNLAGAEAEYEKAWALRRTYDVASQLGSVELELGKHREAAEHLSYAARTFPASGKPWVKAALDERIARANREIGVIRLKMLPVGVRITVDGSAVAIEDGVIFVEPGSHVLVAALEGYRSQTRTVGMGRKTEADVTFELTPEDGGDHGAFGSADLVPIVVGGAVLLAGVAGGIVSVVAANGEADELHAQAAELEKTGGTCGSARAASSASICDAREDTVAAHNRFVGLSVASFVAAGVGLGIGIYGVTGGLGLRRQEPLTGVTLRAVPVVGPGHAGLSFAGAF